MTDITPYFFLLNWESKLPSGGLVPVTVAPTDTIYRLKEKVAEVIGDLGLHFQHFEVYRCMDPRFADAGIDELEELSRTVDFANGAALQRLPERNTVEHHHLTSSDTLLIRMPGRGSGEHLLSCYE